jgi:hypothetical protein
MRMVTITTPPELPPVSAWQRKRFRSANRRAEVLARAAAVPTTAPARPPLYLALRDASADRVQRLADGFRLSPSELRRKARAGWQPARYQRVQICATLERDVTELFPEER